MRITFRLAPHIVVLLLLSSSPANTLAQPVADGSLVDWPAFSDALERAPASGKIILIDVYADTCPWCRKLQSEIYTKVELQSYVYETFELGRINIGIDDDSLTYGEYTLSSAQLGAGFGATGTPTTIFLETDGDYITRLPGFHEYDEFFQVLRFVGTESFRDMSFAEFLESTGETSVVSSGATQD